MKEEGKKGKSEGVEGQAQGSLARPATCVPQHGTVLTFLPDEEARDTSYLPVAEEDDTEKGRYRCEQVTPIAHSVRVHHAALCTADAKFDEVGVGVPGLTRIPNLTRT